MDAELLLDAKATLGEGALWDSRRQRLLWVDIEGHTVHLFDPQTGVDEAIDVGQLVSTVVPRTRGGLMLGVHHGFAALDLSTRKLEVLADPESDVPENRFNDGKCDPAGRFWAGTYSLARKTEAASLWCLDTDLSVRRMLEGVTNSNGIAWSLDGTTMYYIDTATRRVDAFDYRVETGQISNRRAVVVVPEELGKPDGMTLDAEGMLWVALWGGGRVTRWDPGTGKLLQTIHVPAARTSSCALGGPQLDELFITTARIGATEEELRREPHAGGIFVARPGVTGAAALEFAG
jgi:sugar lactone lactonase YvrE